MTQYEIVSIIISIVAIIFALVSLFQVFKQKKIAQGAIELQIESSIIESEKYLVEIIKTGNEPQARKVAIQMSLNAYDAACAKYIDGKIDKDRFRKSYFKAISNLYTEEEFFRFLGYNTSYQALDKVYKSWNNLER